MFRSVFRTLILSLLLYGCSSRSQKQEESHFIADPEHPSTVETREVSLSLRIPTDIVNFFDKTKTGFNPHVICPLEKIPLYNNPEHIALLLGILGVDLSYCTLFEREVESNEYYINIELLGEKLELPEDILEDSHESRRARLENPDSLIQHISKIYTEMDTHFSENNLASLAALTLLGGWIETMYIGVTIYLDEGILEMGDRILEQKYSLNSLSEMLADQQESSMVRRYIHTIDKLKEVYDLVEILYESDDFEISNNEDFFNARIIEINYDPGSLEKICKIILQLRKEVLPLVQR